MDCWINRVGGRGDFARAGELELWFPGPQGPGGKLKAGLCPSWRVYWRAKRPPPLFRGSKGRSEITHFHAPALKSRPCGPQRDSAASHHCCDQKEGNCCWELDSWASTQEALPRITKPWELKSGQQEQMPILSRGTYRLQRLPTEKVLRKTRSSQ